MGHKIFKDVKVPEYSGIPDFQILFLGFPDFSISHFDIPAHVAEHRDEVLARGVSELEVNDPQQQIRDDEALAFNIAVRNT